MKKIITLATVILVSFLIQIISFLPWWSFLIPIFLLGLILPLEKWKVPSFMTGFVAGFLIWLLATNYFAIIYEGKILNKISHMFGMNTFLLYIVIGLMGGTLHGLALYSGFLLRRGKEKLLLKSED